MWSPQPEWGWTWAWPWSSGCSGRARGAGVHCFATVALHQMTGRLGEKGLGPSWPGLGAVIMGGRGARGSEWVHHLQPPAAQSKRARNLESPTKQACPCCWRKGRSARGIEGTRWAGLALDQQSVVREGWNSCSLDQAARPQPGSAGMVVGLGNQRPWGMKAKHTLPRNGW